MILTEMPHDFSRSAVHHSGDGGFRCNCLRAPTAGFRMINFAVAYESAFSCCSGFPCCPVRCSSRDLSLSTPSECFIATRTGRGHPVLSRGAAPRRVGPDRFLPGLPGIDASISVRRRCLLQCRTVFGALTAELAGIHCASTGSDCSGRLLHR